MLVSKAAHRYAKSLLDLAMEKSLGEVGLLDMQKIAKVCSESRDLTTLLKSPVVKQDKKNEILKIIFGSSVSELTSQFLEIIVRKGREMHLQGIAESYIEQYKVRHNVVTANIITATGLDNTIREKILGLVKSKTGKTVELKETLDPEIIGGFILRVDDQQIDQSIASRLKDMKKEFAKNTYIKKY